MKTQSQVETNAISFHSPPEFVNKDAKPLDYIGDTPEKINKSDKKLSIKVFTCEVIFVIFSGKCC